MAVINESELIDITQTTTVTSKEWFGVLEPIDPLELRDIPLSKIKDLNTYEIEILKNTLYQETTTLAKQDLAEWDIAVIIPTTINSSISYTDRSDSVSFAQSSADTYFWIRVDCWAGMVVDTISIYLEKSWTPSGTVSCQLLTWLTADAGWYSGATGTVAETSSTTFSTSSITTSYVKYTFEFAGNLYEWNIFFKIGTGSVNPTSFFRMQGSASAGNSTRTSAYQIDTSGTDDWNDTDDVYIVLEWDLESWIYKWHWDYFNRTIDPFEVMEAVSAGQWVKMNISDVFYKQSGLTPWARYYIDYNGWLTTTVLYNPIGYALTATTIKSLPPSLDFTVVQGSIADPSTNVPWTQTVSHTLGKPPRAIIGTFREDFSSSATYEHIIGFASIPTNGSIGMVEASGNYSTRNVSSMLRYYDSWGDYIELNITSVTSTTIDLTWTEVGIYSDTDPIYYTLFLIS